MPDDDAVLKQLEHYFEGRQANLARMPLPNAHWITIAPRLQRRLGGGWLFSPRLAFIIIVHLDPPLARTESDR
jgi:hypothetical protein